MFGLGNTHRLSVRIDDCNFQVKPVLPVAPVFANRSRRFFQPMPSRFGTFLQWETDKFWTGHRYIRCFHRRMPNLSRPNSGRGGGNFLDRFCAKMVGLDMKPKGRDERSSLPPFQAVPLWDIYLELLNGLD